MTHKVGSHPFQGYTRWFFEENGLELADAACQLFFLFRTTCALAVVKSVLSEEYAG